MTSADSIHDRAQAEISEAHDTGRPLPDDTLGHVENCPVCQGFRASVDRLDERLSRHQIHLSPPYRYRPPRREWLPVAAALLAGLVAGALIGGRNATVQAHELRGLFDSASPALEGMSSSLRILERDWHPEIPQRTYSGTFLYSAPESLRIELVDQTPYPNADWKPNDLFFSFVNGDLEIRSSTPCPASARPTCQPSPDARRIRDLKPFDEAVLAPLEIVGPYRSLTWWAGIDVVGQTELNGQRAIQVETTVSGSSLLSALTDHGAWREFHPTDRVLIWLDRQSISPLRIEVFATTSTERNLWAGRYGYEDQADEPLFVIEFVDPVIGDVVVSSQIPASAASGGFVESFSPVPSPDLPPGFTDHRQGKWLLPEGGTVSTRSWSDGRAWLMVETTTDWTGPHLFGLASPFVQPVDLGGAGVGYLSASPNRLALHSESADAVISGSVAAEVLIEAGESLGIRGSSVPADWEESGVVARDRIPTGTPVPDVAGWSLAGQVLDEQVRMNLTGSGRQNILIEVSLGSSIDPPVGADSAAVEVRGLMGRFDPGTGTLQWVENGTVITMRSSTVALATLLEVADSMTPR